MRLTHKKTLQIIRETDNHYLAAVKGNQPSLHQKILASFRPKTSYFEVNKGHGRLEKRLVEIMPVKSQDYPEWMDITTIIRVTRQRILKNRIQEEICYYISDLDESVICFADPAGRALALRIRGHWGVENRVHYVRDVSFGEDHSRIRTGFLPNIWANAQRHCASRHFVSVFARNFAINLYREAGFTNIAQAQRLCSYGLKHILELFRMK